MKFWELGYGVQFEYIKVNPNFPQIAFWTLSLRSTCARTQRASSTWWISNFIQFTFSMRLGRFARLSQPSDWASLQYDD